MKKIFIGIVFVLLLVSAISAGTYYITKHETFKQAYSIGQKVGYTFGFKSGQSKGYTAGYNSGYDTALKSADAPAAICENPLIQSGDLTRGCPQPRIYRSR